MQEKCLEPCADLTRLEQQIKDLTEQNGADHKEIRERLNEVEKTSAVQNTKYDTILEKLDKLTKKVDALEAKPAKIWDGIVEKAVWAILAAVLAFLLARVGL